MDEQRRIDYLQPYGRMNYRLERERFLNTLNTLRDVVVKMSTLSQDLHSLQEESDFLHADVRALKAKLNQMAQALGLEPLQ